MRRRVFVAVNLDAQRIESIKKMVDGLKSEIPAELLRNIRFLPPDNWHLTVSFLGYQDEDGLVKIIDAIRLAALNFVAPEITLDKLLYGPPKKSPRMIWLLGDKKTSAALNEIRNFLEDELEARDVAFAREKRKFNAHLTLARFGADFRDNVSLPTIHRDVNLKFRAESLDFMESELKKGGAEYTILQQFTFRE